MREDSGSRPVGRARVDRAVGKAPTPNRAPTEVLRVDQPVPPVFVDPSGARRKRLRRVAYTIGVLLVLALLALWLSQLGNSVRPPSTDPCTDGRAGSAAPSARTCPR